MRSRSTDGLLLVDKPAGVTSHDVVEEARRVFGERRIGHTGTLDPFATGLLVLVVGKATRLTPYLDGEPKVYDATIRFGTETDTDDLTGNVTRRAETPPPGSVEVGIRALTGAVKQRPPAYSAKKIGGRRAYALARGGAAPELAEVTVTVHEWVVRAWRGDELDVTISCSGGTYIRALARDLGRVAAGAAHLAALRRTRSGPFDVGDAIPLERLRVQPPPLRSPLDALTLPIEQLDGEAVAEIARGRAVPARVSGERAALVDGEGSLVAIAVRSGSAWQPRVVLRDP